MVLPFYNSAATLEQTLDSIQGQSLTDFELLAVDDGSSDQSATIVAERSREDPRIRLLQPGRIGVAAASNYGIAEAVSDFVARMDADDLMHPQRLAKQYTFLTEHPHIDLVGCQVSLFPKNRVRAGFREYVRWQNSCITQRDIADEVYVELPIANPSVMFKRHRILELAGYRDGAFPEDYDLQLRLVEAGYRLAKIPDVLLYWRESYGRLTRTDSRYSREAFDRLRADYLARDARLQTERPVVVWGAGRKSRKRASLLLERGVNFSAWIDIDPRKVGNIVQGIPVVPPSWLKQQEKPFILGYVTNHGARDLIAAELEEVGYRRGEDYLMVG